MLTLITIAKNCFFARTKIGGPYDQGYELFPFWMQWEGAATELNFPGPGSPYFFPHPV